MNKRFALLCGGMAAVIMLASASFVFAGGQKERSSGALMRSDSTVNVRDTAKYGKFLVGSNGKTLYVFQKDSLDHSNCTGGCASLWPPLVVAAGQTPTKAGQLPGSLGTIKRNNGKYQVTYNGMPLYYFLPDTSPGKVTGQGIQSFGGAWYVVPPDASSFAQAKSMSDHATALARTKAAKPKKSWG